MQNDFPNTRLSVISKIRHGSDEVRRAALEEFVEGYRTALVNFLVSCKQVSVSDAEDLVHEFILNKIMNGKVLELANGQGRFRNALRTCIQRYLIDSIRKKNRDKVVDSAEPEGLDNPEPNFVDPVDQIWAIAIFRKALGRMRNESQYWDLFYDRVLTQPPIAYDQLVQKHGFSSPEKASNCLMTAKRQFNRIMEQCLTKQSVLTDEFSHEELNQEIVFLQKQLLDSQLVMDVIGSLESSSISDSVNRFEWDHSISGEQILFLDESADSNWDKSEASELLQHLVEQPVSQFLNVEGFDENDKVSDFVLGNGDVVADQESLRVIHDLKEVFNERGKSRKSQLPKRINVTMTFLLVARFVVAGGEVERITSMRRDVLTDRLSQLVDKDWIPLELRNIIKSGVNKLLE